MNKDEAIMDNWFLNNKNNNINEGERAVTQPSLQSEDDPISINVSPDGSSCTRLIYYQHLNNDLKA